MVGLFLHASHVIYVSGVYVHYVQYAKLLRWRLIVWHIRNQRNLQCFRRVWCKRWARWHVFYVKRNTKPASVCAYFRWRIIEERAKHEENTVNGMERKHLTRLRDNNIVKFYSHAVCPPYTLPFHPKSYIDWHCVSLSQLLLLLFGIQLKRWHHRSRSLIIL